MCSVVLCDLEGARRTRDRTEQVAGGRQLHAVCSIEIRVLGEVLRAGLRIR
jgi:hypothetical protein